MKKIFSILMVFAMLLTLSACSCEHEWKEADCMNKKTCIKCDETEGEPLGHQWKDADCTNPKICTVCSETEGEVLGHQWKDADCINPKSCTVCNVTEGKAKGHNFSAATYEKPQTCKTCGETRGKKLTRPTEWGFNNLAEMDYMLVRISSYSIISQKNAYVTLPENISLSKFENGYRVNYDYEVKNGKCVLLSSGNTEKYTIVTNDNLDINNGWRSFRIQKRIVSDVKNNFVAFNIYRDSFSKDILYVPYTLIDWSKGIQKNSNGEKILYLIP